MTIGLPTIDVQFKKLAQTVIARSSAQIAVLIVKDNTDATHAVKEYSSPLDIDAAKFTAANVKYIKDVLAGGGSKVIVVPVATASTAAVADAVAAIGSRKFNWIGLAEGDADEQNDLVTFAKLPASIKKGIKAVVYQAADPDSSRIVNFTNEDVTYAGGTTVTGEKYIARLLGVLTGLPLTQSSTYLELSELVGVTEPADLDTAIGDGELVLFNDDGKIRIARGVNSLVTLTPGVTDDFKKIVIVETMDLMKADIAASFKDSYLGKFKNKYDNQVLFISAVNAYFASLAADSLLDDAFANKADVNVAQQRAAWVQSGKAEAAGWDDQMVKNNAFGSSVFLGGNVKIPDAMEDLSFEIYLQ
ncbi:phage tail sheath protein [Paenibacillus sp. MWE-103]|uniref:Phage tail sheath protein n=1 Tax=Paenibacillus artemisiicola TaxID=1172618 RepID=A0ABS3WGB4_9BACL|nr:phage tail sheath protein [Paenibacillus artemisiicola]